jgi:transposase InsO family protein
MIAFIDDHRRAYGVEPICRVLPIAPSTYYVHVAKRADPTKRSAREQCDTALQADIRRVWDANFQVYGVRKVWRQLRREAIAAPRCQVARLMKRMGLAGAVRGRTVKTTHSDKSAPCPLDRVNRQFRAPARCGCQTLPTSPPGKGLSMSPSLSTFLRDASSVGGRPDRPVRTLCWTRWNRRCAIAVRSARVASSITATVACRADSSDRRNASLCWLSSGMMLVPQPEQA